MKKYLLIILISIIIGFFMSLFVLKNYDGLGSIAVYNSGDEYYLFQRGVYATKEEMEKNAINLENYIYRKEDNKYLMYIAITGNENNIDRIKKYYEDKSIKVEVKNVFISNKKFKEAIDNLDNILVNSNDEVVLNEIINQGLSKYEEVVLNGKN